MKEIKNEAEMIEYLHDIQMSADPPLAVSARLAKDLLPPFAKVLLREREHCTNAEHVVRGFTSLMGSILYNVVYAYAKPGCELMVAQAITGKICLELTRMIEEDAKHVANKNTNG